MSTEHETKAVHFTFSSDLPDFIADWAEEFLKAKKLEGVSGKTLNFYQWQMKYFSTYCHGQLFERVSQISSSAIRNYLIWLEEQGHNPGGVHAAYRVLKTFLRWYDLEAEPEGWKNPISKVKAPRLSEEPLEPVDLATVKAMVNVCDDSFLGKRNQALLLFLLDTGLRARELLSLDIEDVNHVTGAIFLRVGKGHKPRTVAISRETKKELRLYLRARKDSLPVLWITEDQTSRLSYPALRKMLKTVSALAKVKTPTAHSFRRAFALNMLRKGVSLEAIARMMGHTSLQVLRRYLKLIDGDLLEAHAQGSPVKSMRL